MGALITPVNRQSEVRVLCHFLQFGELLSAFWTLYHCCSSQSFGFNDKNIAA
jgi:hypothetical protein